ncbi:hypothetical protein FBU31_006613, partial [Coemansia sp. 'formosensis']
PPQRPVTGSPGGGRGGDDVLGLARPRIRDAGSRPSSMYAGGAAVLEPPVMSAVQRTVAGQQQTSPGGAQRGLKSKWSQYFTSTAEAEPAAAPRTRSESLSAPAVAAAAAAAAPKAQRPAHSSNSSVSTTPRQPPAAAADPVPARMAGSAAALRAVGASPALAGERSRSATLPENAGGTRACTTCGRGLRVEEQRQFATQPGVVYCTACYHSSYSRGACAGCGKVVLTHGRPWAQYGDKVWHKLCIRCRACSRLLVAPLVADDGEPCCEPCLAAKGSRSEPPVPSAIGGSTVCPRPPSPVSGRSSAATEPRSFAEPRSFSSGAEPRSFAAPPAAALAAAQAKAQAQALAQASIPTPVMSEYDAGEPLDARLSGLRIMSPVEVAAHQGLPPPRAIVDPDSPAAPAESPPPLGIPQAAPRPSPSLRPSTASRTASPRSVSFRIDEPPAAVVEVEVVDVEAQPRSLADYVLSKASTTARAKPGVVASVADTIKKLADAAAQSGSVKRTGPAVALPELHDLIRTHQRDAPTDPT